MTTKNDTEKPENGTAEDVTQATINELKTQIELLTKKVAEQANRSTGAETSLKNKEVTLKIETFNEPSQKSTIKTVTMKGK